MSERSKETVLKTVEVQASAAHRVSSERFDSCSLRSTELIWVSTVLMEMNSSEATSLYV